MVASHSSSVSSSNGRAMSTPALLTRTPISPSAAATCSDRGGDLLRVGHVGRRAGGLDARRRAARPPALSTLAAVRAQTPTR